MYVYLKSPLFSGVHPGAFRVVDPGLMGFVPPEFAVRSGGGDEVLYSYGKVFNVSPGQDTIVVFEVAVATDK